MNNKLKIFSVLVAIFTTSCSTILSGTTQNIHIITPFAKGANCSASNSSNYKVFVPSTPGTVTVKKGAGALYIECSKKGFKDTNLYFSDKVSPLVAGNILIGGILGLIVDLTTGAHKHYDNTAYVFLEPKGLNKSERTKWQNKVSEFITGIKETKDSVKYPTRSKN